MAGGHTPFAVLNRTGNPIVRAILRSPLHGLLSRGRAAVEDSGTVVVEVDLDADPPR
jgi:hypothetical protein